MGEWALVAVGRISMLVLALLYTPPRPILYTLRAYLTRVSQGGVCVCVR